MSVIHNSRGTTFIRRCPTASTSSSTNILQPANGGIRPRSTLAYSDFFSQLRFLFAVSWHTSFPPIARSLHATGNRYSSLQSCCSIQLSMSFWAAVLSFWAAAKNLFSMSLSFQAATPCHSEPQRRICSPCLCHSEPQRRIWGQI